MRQRTRLIGNVLTNYGALGVYGVANAFLVGYVIRMIGKDAFGLVALVMSLTIVTELLGRGIGQALTKHMAADASKGDVERLDRFVNTSLAWLTGCGVLGAVICLVLSGLIDRIARIPDELVPEARVAMWLMGLRVLVCFPFNTFQSVLWAYQRYDLTNLARVVGIMLRVVLVVAYFELVSGGVVELVALTIVSLVVERLVWIVSVRRVAPQLRFGRSLVSWTTLGTLVGFGGLMLVIDVANLVGYEAVKWIIGFKLSVMDVGAYTLLATLAAFAGTMVRSIAGVLTPVASRFDALEQRDQNARLALLSTKYGVIVAGGLCLAPLALLEPFLLIWVGDAYPKDYLSRIAIAGAVLLLGQWFISTAVCLLQMLTGVGRLWVPASITLGWALGGLTAVGVCVTWGNGTMLAAVIAISIARIVGSIAHVIYGVRVLCFDSRGFFTTAIARPACAGIIACAAGEVVAACVDVDGISSFLGAAGFVALVYSLATWLISLSPAERTGIIEQARRLICRAPSTNAL